MKTPMKVGRASVAKKARGECKECREASRELEEGRCPACRKKRADKLWTMSAYTMQERHPKLPQLERFQNCELVIDKARGVVWVNLNGRTKVKIQHIPLARLRAEMIDLVAWHGEAAT